MEQNESFQNYVTSTLSESNNRFHPTSFTGILSVDSNIKSFIMNYVTTYESLLDKVSSKDRHLLFPSYIAYRRTITCKISDKQGFAIEFGERNKDWEVEIRHIKGEIERAVLPSESDPRPIYEISASNTIIKHMNLVTRSYYDKNKEFIESLSRATNMVGKGLGRFISVKSGDVRLIDVGLGWVENNKSRAKRISCLWIFAHSDTTRLTTKLAQELAMNDYAYVVYTLLGGHSLSLLVSNLDEYERLIGDDTLPEEKMQTFLENNFMMLQPNFTKVYTKGDLRAMKFPEADFLVHTSDEKYILVEIETPHDDVFTNEVPPNPSKDLRISETQMQGYLSFVKNNILYCRTHFPNISAENVSGLLVIGRSSKLSVTQKEALKRVNGTTSGYTITTYDELFSQTKALLENISIRYGSFQTRN